MFENVLVEVIYPGGSVFLCPIPRLYAWEYALACEKKGLKVHIYWRGQ